MDRELAGVLADLGLSATEAAVYVALLKCTRTGSVSSYKLAQEMGRDPANLTKVLAAMHRRGVVRVSGRRPRLYTPVALDDFTSRLITRLQERRQQALAMLRDIGSPPPDQDLHTLDSRREALACARRLICGARHTVLVEGTAELLAPLADALSSAATRQDTAVLAICPGAAALPGVTVRSAGGPKLWHGAAPGPWLRLSVDGESCLEMLAHPAGGDELLQGRWSCCPIQSFQTHRSLVAELILAELHEHLRDGVDGTLACGLAVEQAAQILHQIPWRQHWHDAGLPGYEFAAPAAPVRDEKEPAETTATPAAANASTSTVKEKEKGEAVAEAAAGGQDDALQFVFRRSRPDPESS